MPVITHPEESCVPHTTTVRESIKSSGVTCGKVKSALLPLTALIHLVSVSLNVAQRPNPASRNIKTDMPCGARRPGYLPYPPEYPDAEHRLDHSPQIPEPRRAIERMHFTEDQGHNHPSLHNPTRRQDYLGAAQKSVPQASTLPKAGGKRQPSFPCGDPSMWPCGTASGARKHTGRPTETSAGPPKGVFSTEAMVPSICSPSWLANPAYLVSCAATPLFSPRPPCCKAHPQTTVRHPTIRQRNIVDIN